MDKLVENPYASRYTDPVAASFLCAEFKRMIFQDGVPIRPSKGHYPDYLALTETELRDTSYHSRGVIHRVSISLREAALEKFPPLCKAEVPPSHVLLPVESAPVVILFGRHRQMAASMPLPEPLQHQMKG